MVWLVNKRGKLACLLGIATTLLVVELSHRRARGTVSCDRQATCDDDTQSAKRRDPKSAQTVNTQQDVDRLLTEIRSRIHDPWPTGQRTKTRRKTDHSQANQSTFIDKLNGGMRGGFFVECGAADGQTLSNSLFFEIFRNWTGLLIEANVDLFRDLEKLKRHAYATNTCVSTSSEPQDVTFHIREMYGGINGTMDAGHIARTDHYIKANESRFVNMRCYPLHRMLQAIGQRHVDYLSLDVEGPELDILKTIPYDEVEIDYMTVEYRVLGDRSASQRKLEDIRAFMASTGRYEFVSVLPTQFNDSAPSRGLDVVFKRKGI